MLKKLQKGDLIDIVSPASVITFEDLAEIQEYLTQKGFRSRYFLAEEIFVYQPTFFRENLDLLDISTSIFLPDKQKRLYIFLDSLSRLQSSILG